MKIGSVETKNDLVLAPMANYTDGGFRYLASGFGVGLTVTEMVSAKGLCYGSKNTELLLRSFEKNNPVAVQIFGSETEYISKACKHSLLSNFDIIDINMGCPVNKVVNNGEGSALLQNPNKVYDIVKSAVDSTNKPVTVKIRAGFSSDNINAVEVAKIIEKAGASAVAIHARTRDQFYSGEADWNIIKEVKENVGITVIGNGDIATRDDYIKMKEFTKCDGVMVGRGALGKPFVFAELLDYRTKINVKDIILKHIEILMLYLPERTVVNQMKSHLCFYAKNVGHAKEVRKVLQYMDSYDKMMEYIDEFFGVEIEL